MNNCSNIEDSKLLLSSYSGNENINELVTFFTLTKRFNFSLLKEIYTPNTFNKYFETLKSINLINDIEDKEIQEANIKSVSKIFSISSDWLRYFVILAEIKNMASAAKKLNITTSTLSKSITGIEETLQLILFERDKNFEELTYAGKIVYKKCKDILSSLYELNMIGNDAKSGNLFGEINIAWATKWGKDIIFPSIKDFMGKYPNVFFKTSFVPKNKIEKLILEGIYDISFIPNEPLSENIEVAGTIEIEHVIVSSPQPKKNWNEFSYIVNFSKNCSFSESNILNLWPNEKYPRKILMECASLNMTVEFCKSGFGAAFLPLSIVKKELEEGSLAIVADPPFNKLNKLYIVCRKGIFTASILYEFIKEIKNNS